MFIMNLAAADLLVLVFCLPATVIQDVTKTWFFGLILCKFVNYIQVNEDVRSIEENAICACFVFFLPDDRQIIEMTRSIPIRYSF